MATNTLLLGLGILTAGAELLVRGGSSLARHLGMTPLLIGLTVVTFGTSALEMLVSVGGLLLFGYTSYVWSRWPSSL